MRNERAELDISEWDEIHVDGWFKGLIPPDWEIEDDEEVIIFDPAGFGELRISMFVKNNNKNKKQRAAEIIRDWEAELGGSYKKDVSVFKRRRGLFSLSAEFIGTESDGEMIFWRVFPVIGEKVSLDISYSCPLEDRISEEAIVENIIDSIALLEPAMEKVKVPLVD